MRTWFTAPVFLCVLACAAGQRLAADDAAARKTADTFFAGTVRESSAEMVIGGQDRARANAESRTFRLTPDTKIEGTLESKVRVTVRYVTDDDGDTATLIVVHALARPTSKSKKP